MASTANLEDSIFTILIVDDEEMNIQILEHMLRPDGYNLTSARNGLETLEYFKTNTADLILLDIMMPDIDGFMVFSELQKQKSTSSIPVIFVTSLADINVEAKCLEIGGVDFVSKPLSASVIRARIKTHIELKMHRDHLEELVQKRTKELQEAIDHIKTLKGLLPICANCKKIRDDKGYWNKIEVYIQHHSEAEFTHGICPQCAKELHPDLYSDMP